MIRPASRYLALLVPALALALTSCGKGEESGSELDAVAKPLNIGDASARHGMAEVLIYYANETAPDKDEKANWDSILASLKSDEQTAFMTQTLENDLRLFPLVVDDETKALKDYFCTENNKRNVSLVIFTNRLTRAGFYEFCEAGKPAETRSDTYMGKLRTRKAGDFRTLSNPLSDKESLRWALARARALFAPDSHIYSFVMKSHGNPDYVITPRLHVQAKRISRKALIASLKSTMAAAPKEAADGASTDGPTLDEVNRRSAELKKEIEASDKALEKLIRAELDSNSALRDSLAKNELIKNELMKNELLKNELMKNELFKNELMKNELFKNELMKNELFKNELMKNELMKNELMKNELAKNELMKNELAKNELAKNELMKNELAKNELMKNELSKNELAADGATAADGVEEGTDLAKAVLPRIGVTKREFLGAIAEAGVRTNKKLNMHFSVVFTESCRSYLPWDLKADIAEASEALKVDYLASSDEGSVRYKNIDYDKFLGSLDEKKSFGENLKDELSRVAEEAKK